MVELPKATQSSTGSVHHLLVAPRPKPKVFYHHSLVVRVTPTSKIKKPTNGYSTQTHTPLCRWLLWYGFEFSLAGGCFVVRSILTWVFGSVFAHVRSEPLFSHVWSFSGAGNHMLSLYLTYDYQFSIMFFIYKLFFYIKYML